MLNTCLFGDCRESLKAIAEAGIKAQTCVTSPPYFGLRDYGHPGQLGLEPTPEDYVSNMVEVFRAVRDVLADDGTLWLNLGDSYGKGKQLLGIPWKVAFALQSDGWILRQDIIWYKPNPLPESVKDRCTKSHEYIFLLTKSEKYYYDNEAVHEDLAPWNPKWGKEGVPPAVGTRGGLPLEEQVQQYATKPGLQTTVNVKFRDRSKGKNRRSVWTVAKTRYLGAHFATFPPALIEPCVLAGSRPGDIVLDPFMGSGTTAQVAESLGRNWIGCELNPEYETLIFSRLGRAA